MRAPLAPFTGTLQRRLVYRIVLRAIQASGQLLRKGSNARVVRGGHGPGPPPRKSPKGKLVGARQACTAKARVCCGCLGVLQRPYTAQALQYISQRLHDACRVRTALGAAGQPEAAASGATPADRHGVTEAGEPDSPQAPAPRAKAVPGRGPQTAAPRKQPSPRRTGSPPPGPAPGLEARQVATCSEPAEDVPGAREVSLARSSCAKGHGATVSHVGGAPLSGCMHPIVDAGSPMPVTSWYAHALEQTALEASHPGRPDLASSPPPTSDSESLQLSRLPVTATRLSNDGSGTGTCGTHADPEESTGKEGSDSLSDGECQADRGLALAVTCRCPFSIVCFQVSFGTLCCHTHMPRGRDLRRIQGGS
jgi:hypothetical protein